MIFLAHRPPPIGGRIDSAGLLAGRRTFRAAAWNDVREPEDHDIMSHAGTCFCGTITLEVDGPPEAMGYCHCNSCRSWSGGPVNAFSLWKPAAVRVTSGAEHIATFQKSELSQRQYCAKCGGHLMTNHPTLGLVDVFAATIPTLRFEPGVHVNYAENVLPMKDGLPSITVAIPEDF
jgi:hypothetical protein